MLSLDGRTSTRFKWESVIISNILPMHNWTCIVDMYAGPLMTVPTIPKDRVVNFTLKFSRSLWNPCSFSNIVTKNINIRHIFLNEGVLNLVCFLLPCMGRLRRVLGDSMPACHYPPSVTSELQTLHPKCHQSLQWVTFLVIAFIVIHITSA